MVLILMVVLIFCLSPYPCFDLEWRAFVEHAASPTVKTLPSFPLASWEGCPVPKKSAGGAGQKEGSFFYSTLVRAGRSQIRGMGTTWHLFCKRRTH